MRKAGGCFPDAYKEVPPAPLPQLPHLILLATEAWAAVSRDVGCSDGELEKDVNGGVQEALRQSRGCQDPAWSVRDLRVWESGQSRYR